MTLQEYINGLVKFAEENPETKEMMVVTSKDDEGNGYSLVYFAPSKGYYDEDEEDFTELLPDDEDAYYDEEDTNAVCVN